jgi:hypothetical protein
VTDTFDYTESRFDADELIAEFGQVVSIRKSTASGTAWAPAVATADSPTYGARVEFTRAQIARGNVLETDSRWLIAAGALAVLGVEPAANDALVVGAAVVGRFVKVEPLNPAGVAVMYDCHVRA